MEHFIDKDEHIGLRIDSWLVLTYEDKTRSFLQKLIENGDVTVNKKAVAKNYRLRKNDVISVTIPPPREADIEAQNIPLDIIYEDNDLIIVNKQKGIVVHPAPGNYDKTLVNSLLFHYKDSLSGINGVVRPGIVHRIDKDTSGLLIVAKSDNSHLKLANQIKEHSFTREYEAVVYGRLKDAKGTICAPIGRDKLNRQRMAVTEKNSKNAVTHYEIITQYEGFAHIRLRLETGRTHQIRVHMAYIGHPVAGDPVYGPRKIIKGLEGQCLHAKKIGFIHPSKGEYVEFESRLPRYFTDFLKTLKEA